MRIVVDGRPLLTREHTGIGVYTAAALEATAQAAPDIHFELVCTGKAATLHYVPKFLAVKILSLSEPTLADKLKQHKKDLESSVQKNANDTK
jgi:phosphoribosylcarboxyaminoimidazole (NCAIR) mutase